MDDKKDLKDYINTHEKFKIFGVSEHGHKVQVRTVELSECNSFYGYKHKMVTYDKNGKITSTDNFISLNHANNTILDGIYTYYLEPKTPYQIVIHRLRAEKRRLDRIQMDAQCELRKYVSEYELA